MAIDWSVAVGPTQEPVSLTEAKDHLRYSGTAEDTLIGALIGTAREQCELVARRAFVTQTIELRLPAWPLSASLRMPQPPLIDVLAVEYRDQAGVLRTVDPETYTALSGDPGMLLLWSGESWPSEPLMPGLPITIRYRAGYGSASAVPRRYKQAILLLVGTWFAMREHVTVGSVAREMPNAVRSLLMTDRG